MPYKGFGLVTDNMFLTGNLHVLWKGNSGRNLKYQLNKKEAETRYL